MWIINENLINIGGRSDLARSEIVSNFTASDISGDTKKKTMELTHLLIERLFKSIKLFLLLLEDSKSTLPHGSENFQPQRKWWELRFPASKQGI